MKLAYSNIEVKIHNQREKGLVSIFNERCKRYVENWHDKFWHDDFNSQGFMHWRILECSGLTSAMYFLEMIDEPISAVEIFECLRDEATERRA